MDQFATYHLVEDFELLAIGKDTIFLTLKFLISNIKHIMRTQLTSENYPTWRSQILKIFRANDFFWIYHQTCSISRIWKWNWKNQSKLQLVYARWSKSCYIYVFYSFFYNFIIYSSIGKSMQKTWVTLECRLQASNRSHII